MTQLLIIVGIIVGILAFSIIVILPEMVNDRRTRKATQAAQQARTVTECDHTWTPWEDPVGGLQTRSCIICNAYSTQGI